MATYKVIVQGGYMSGDMFGVAAAMVLDPTVCVSIVKGTGTNYLALMDDQSDRLLAFYKEVLGDLACARRVVVGTIDDPQAYIKGITGLHGALDQNKAPNIKSMFGWMGRFDFVVLHRIGKATDIVSTTFDWGKIVDAFTINNLAGSLRVFFSQVRYQRLLDRESPRVFLWVRINKKKPKATAHLELDTSVEGLRQITRRIVADNLERKKVGAPPWIVALTGDRIDLTAPRNKVLKDNCVDMMEYWNDPKWDKRWGRRGQLTAFAELLVCNAKIVNVGMRSGGLEGPALLGIPTFYMEEAGNPQQARMEKWVGPLKLHIGPSSYHRFELTRLPTRTGQAIKQSTTLADPGAIARLLDEATLESPGTNRDRLAAAKGEYHRTKKATYGEFFGIWLSLAGDFWSGRTDQDCPTWKSFAGTYPKAAAKVRTQVGKWYGLRVAKEGSVGNGFAGRDIDALMVALGNLFPDPPPPKVEVVVPKVIVPVKSESVVEKPKPLLVVPKVDVKPRPTPPKRLSEMSQKARTRWRRTIREAGYNPDDF